MDKKKLDTLDLYLRSTDLMPSEQSIPVQQNPIEINQDSLSQLDSVLTQTVPDDRQAYLREFAFGLADKRPAWRRAKINETLKEVTDPYEREWLLNETTNIAKAIKWKSEKEYKESGFMSRRWQDVKDIAGGALTAGASDVEAATSGLTRQIMGKGLSPEDIKFKQRLDQAVETENPTISEHAGFIGGMAQKATRMVPSLYTAAKLGSVGQQAATATGATAATAANIGGGVGIASFFPQMQQQSYERMVAEGVSPETAKWSSTASGALQSLLFSKLPGKVFSKLGGKEATAKAITDITAKTVATNYAKNVASGAGLMSGAAVADATVRELSRWAEGKGAPEVSEILKEGGATFIESLGTMAILGAPKAIGETHGYLDSKRSEMYKNDIIKADAMKATPSKGWLLKRGIEPGETRAESRERLRAKAEELRAIEQPLVEAPIEQQKPQEQPLEDAVEPIKPTEYIKSPEITGLAKELVAEVRIGRGESPLEGRTPEQVETWLTEGQNARLEDKYLENRIIERLQKEPGSAVNEREEAILQLAYRDRNNAFDAASERLFSIAETGDPAEIVKAQADANAALGLVRDVEVAADMAHSTWGKTGVAMKIALKRDFSPASLLRKAKVAKGGQELTPEETTKIAEMGKQIQELEVKIKGYESGELTPETPRAKSFAKKDTAKKAVDAAWVEFKAAISGRPMEGIITGESGALNVDIAKASLKLAKAYSKLGIATVDEFLVNAKENLGDKFDEYKESLVSAWGRRSELTLEQRIKRLNSNLDRSIKKLEGDIEEGRIGFKKKPESISTPELDAKRAKLDELREVRDQMREDAGLTEERKNEIYKKNLEKRIAKYEQKIEIGEFTKPEKYERTLNKELIDLKFKAEQVKSRFKIMQQDWEKQQQSTLIKTLNLVPETLNFSRALMTSLDLSAVLRQGGFFAFGHPIKTAEMFPDMIKAMLSHKGEFAAAENIRNRPDYQFMKQSGVSFTVTEGAMGLQEETYMGGWLHKLAYGEPKTALGKVLLAPAKLLTKPVIASERAYITLLNRMRADMFGVFSATLTRTGKPTLDEGKAIANFINVATGRAGMGKLQSASNALATAFFAPRYTVSRFQLILGQPMLRGTARTRMLVAKEYARTLIGVATFYGVMNAIFGDDIRFEWDSRSSDFGKVIFKDGVRIDPLMGIAQPTVLSTRLSMGLLGKNAIKKPTGELIKLSEGWGSPGASDLISRFLRGKLSPWLGTAIDITEGKTLVGEEVTPLSAAGKALSPLSFGDIYDVMKKDHVPRGVALSMLIILGMGAQNYQNARPEMFAKKIAEHPKLRGFNKQSKKSYDYSTLVDQVIEQSRKNGLSYEEMASALDQQLRNQGMKPETRKQWKKRLRIRLSQF